MNINCLGIILALMLFTCPSFAELRIATFNVKHLNACIKKAREPKLKEVIKELDADIIAFQEIRDRAALEFYLPKESWNIIIDDDSTDDLNLAFALKKELPYSLISGEKLNPDSRIDFLFPKEPNFIEARRVLRVKVDYKGETLNLLNHHAKSRYNGREKTDQIRTNAALAIVNKITDLSLENVILVGDFNDTPDDRSLNTLESGYESPMRVENQRGAFLVNLTEKLMIDEHVSFGLNNSDKINSIIPRIKTAQQGSRLANINAFLSDDVVKHALYDQILVSPEVEKTFPRMSVSVFDNLSAIIGNSDTRASDHLPVVLDINCTKCKKPQLFISKLLPNPFGSDKGNEVVFIKNKGAFYSGEVILKDASNRHIVLNINLNLGQEKAYTLERSITLNNNGDTVLLLDADENILDNVSYKSSSEGDFIQFD